MSFNRAATRFSRTPANWLLLAAGCAVVSYYFFDRVDQFLLLQEQEQTTQLSVTGFVAVPMLAQASHLFLILIAAVAPLGLLMPQRHGMLQIMLASPLDPFRLCVQQWSALLLIPIVVWIYLLLLCSSLIGAAQLDWGQIIAGALGVLMTIIVLTTAALWVSARTESPAACIALTLILFVLLWFIDQAAISRGVTNSLLSQISLSSGLRAFLGGELVLSTMVYWSSLAACFLLMAYAGLRGIKGMAAWPVRVGALLLPISALLLTPSISQRWDLTDQSKNTLSPASALLVEQIQQSLDILVFSSSPLPARPALQRFFDRYTRANSNIRVNTLNPAEHLQLVRELNVTDDGTVFLHSNNRYIPLEQFSERGFAQTLNRLINPQSRLVAYAFGSGERDFRGGAGFDTGRFGQVLETRGISLQPFDMLLNPAVPDNMELLILTSSTQQQIPEILESITQYVKDGGNLLWLTDPPFSVQAASLYDALGITPVAGRLLDARSTDYGFSNPTQLLIRHFGQHEITQRLANNVVLTDALAFELANDSQWNQTALLSSSDSSWNETGRIVGEVRMDPDQGEQQGPLTVGVALTRSLDKKSGLQRIAVVGDGDFISNQFLGQGGNLDLGVRLVDWLLDTNQTVDIPVRFSQDNRIDIAPGRLGFLGLLLMVIIPSILLMPAGLRIWRNRHA